MNNDFQNELKNELSPYLLQHAHNPVHWQVWSESLLQKAKALNKPLLISIGYSSCHWCHVMERESFEDPEIAESMNEYFINVKIDREERPDLDHFFMDALQAMTGSGGWPLNVFATPEGKPFFGGTYFPPEKMINRPSWKEVLDYINKLWTTNRDEVQSQAERLMNHLEKNEQLFSNNFSIPEQDHATDQSSIINSITDKIMANADVDFGGFGNAPKFPQLSSIQYLFTYHHYTQSQQHLDFAINSLKHMLMGGIYDQIGGGLARYSTDNKWLVPHFEKMLYDNALLITVLCEAYQITGDLFFEEYAAKTIAFCERELKAKDGGYYTALDADSDGVEGKYYVWEQHEIDQILGEDSMLFSKFYDVSEEGNWEGVNVLNLKQDFQSFALQNGLNLDELKNNINTSAQKLLSVRQQRVAPKRDYKIILSQNAQLLSALSKAAVVFQKEEYEKMAIELYNFIAAHFIIDHEITHHCTIQSIKKQNACLDDYAYLIQAFIRYYELNGDEKILLEANRLSQTVLNLFSSLSSPLFYFSDERHKDIIQRKIAVYDSPSPSANAVMVENFQYLGQIFDNSNFIHRAENMIQTVFKLVVSYPGSFSAWASLLIADYFGYLQVVITGKNAPVKLRDVLKIYFPFRVVQAAESPKKWPLVSNKSFPIDALIYVCDKNKCLEPFVDAGFLKKKPLLW